LKQHLSIGDHYQHLGDFVHFLVRHIRSFIN
jgi:hypothetical protein